MAVCVPDFTFAHVILEFFHECTGQCVLLVFIRKWDLSLEIVPVYAWWRKSVPCTVVDANAYQTKQTESWWKDVRCIIYLTLDRKALFLSKYRPVVPRFEASLKNEQLTVTGKQLEQKFSLTRVVQGEESCWGLPQTFRRPVYQPSWFWFTIGLDSFRNCQTVKLAMETFPAVQFSSVFINIHRHCHY